MPSQHKHRLAAFAVELFEQHERFFVETQASLHVSVYDVKSILAPVVGDVVSFERHGKDYTTWVVDADSEGFEDFDLRIILLRDGACTCSIR
jgi:hypothetical protein